MATVSSFESLRFPSKSDLAQFGELFEQLYAASTEEARRQAVAALSRCPQVPEETALFIARQPISTAAIFLMGSRAIGDVTLMRILRTTGPEHAHAIGRRDDLSPIVVEALVGTYQDHASRRTGEDRAAALAEAARLEREERVREELRALMRAATPIVETPVRLEPASVMHQVLFVRFAREGETGMIAVALADALASSQWLSERILLDVSGRQLAETLLALEVPQADALFVLKAIYPHLAEGGAQTLLAALDPAEATRRVESWQRADSYTSGDGLPKAANADDAPQDRSAAGHKRAAG
ncbi:hypothetical protein [Shinella zoogloeoides]|uniref:DUF2336 domain-containing protein n=1 Tax=Shinella zoogloeoides TaxID=352475 RepID=A0A6N8TDH2_SHIZO|nr:hypothetical protein [Shinella zoogloeoides]MXO00226.1 hypothetical protein [Shinella zoogloeoides]UEX82548.1 hypothetical protein K8M09_04510 [Shinella zoogloeoides]